MRSAISPVRDLGLIWRLYRLLSEIQPDLIHCHSSKAGMLGRVAGRLRGLPVLFTIHGWSWASVSGRKAQLALQIERRLSHLRNVHYLYVCQAVATIGQRMLGVRPEQGRVVYNGVPDLGIPVTPPADPPCFIMPARVAYPKDHNTLIRAFDTLPPGNRLLLCGAGTDTAEFAAQLPRLAPRRHADILGLGQRSDMATQLHAVHVMVLSSRSEAMPLSIIEAMSAGLPVIASDVGGIHEQVSDGVTGLLVPAGDVAATAAAMTRLLDSEQRQRIGAAGRQRYESYFTAETMAAATLGV